MLSKFIHPLLYQLIRFAFSKDNLSVSKIKNAHRIFICLAADYGNIGDIAITIAVERYLRNLFPEREIIKIPASKIYINLKSFINNLNSKDLICFVGGGNSGDLYYPYEIYRQLVVLFARHNQIIVFPQSIKFNSVLNKKMAAVVYGTHSNITYTARDHSSYDFIKQHYKIPTLLLPDIVMTLNMFSNEPRQGIALCMRNDKERLLTDADNEYIIRELNRRGKEFEKIDTYRTIDSLSESDSNELFLSLIRKIGTKKLLITDRLHGMIFGFITGTTTLVFNNNNSKIKECFDWVKNCGYIRFIGSINNFEKEMDNVDIIKPQYRDFSLVREQILTKFENLSSIINYEN